MLPNFSDYKIIKVKSENLLKCSIMTTYTTPTSSIFNIFSNTSKVQKYPIVYKIDEKSDVYKAGLRIGHQIIKLNGYSLAYKDIKTVQSDFTYEKKSSDFLTLTIL